MTPQQWREEYLALARWPTLDIQTLRGSMLVDEAAEYCAPRDVTPKEMIARAERRALALMDRDERTLQ